MGFKDKRPHQILPVSHGNGTSQYPNNELRYIGPRAKSGYRHGKVYEVNCWPSGGRITVSDLRYPESLTKGMPDKVYDSFEDFCKEWENEE